MKLKFIPVLLLLLWYCPATLPAMLSSEDIKWLNRITYGINSQVIGAYETQGKKRYLDLQLANSTEDALPGQFHDMIAKMQIAQKPAELLAADFNTENKRIRDLPAEQRLSAHNVQNSYAKQLMEEATQRHLLRALYSPAQIKEQMVWFWLNHFSVFRGKGMVRLLVADYEESAIRPHALGKFRDLLMATLRHPAMLVYLDNSYNGVGKINENYARELMELHTLGIDGGYSQQDVQALARILAGAGVNWGQTPPKLNKKWASYYLRNGNFEFNPKRHDFGEKQFLGKKIGGDGFAEIAQVVDMLSRHPATAKFICRKLAMYFVSDAPAPELIEQMVKTFQSTDGDIAATLRTLFESKGFTDSLGKKISDPMHYVLAAIRLAYDQQSITDTEQLSKWLNRLGEPLYGHLTPDGYGMAEKDWISPEQLTKHFETAKQIVNVGLPVTDKDFSLKRQKLSGKPLYQMLVPMLSDQTKTALEKASSAAEWNMFLLSAPEFIYR